MRHAVLAVCLAVIPAVGGPEPRYFRYERPVTATDAVAGPHCVTLDATAVANAAADLSDIRLYDAGREVPFVVDPEARAAAETAGAPTVLNRGARDGHVVFDAHVLQPSYGAIELGVDGKDFVASVDVTGSMTAGGASPTALGTYTIFDLTGQQLSRSTILHLPASNFPYLHFVVTGLTKPEQITGVTMLDAPLRPMVYIPVAEAATISRQGNRSVVTFTLGSHVPVDRVEIVPADTARNFSRGVTVSVTQGKAPASVRATGTVFRVRTVRNGFQINESRLAVDVTSGLSGSEAGQWTVAIDNGDDVPLALRSIRLVMRARRICFDAVSGVHYTMMYGDSTLRAPRYDYATLFRDDAPAGDATLGPEEGNPAFTPRPDSRPLTERHPVLLWGVLALVVLGLAAVTMNTAKTVKPVDGAK